jgi:nitrite reductase/ring-hydroxylating ferredoxin subunit
MNTSKYGEDFIYIVPYTVAFERLFKKQKYRLNSARTGNVTLFEGYQEKPLLEKNFINTKDFESYLKTVYTETDQVKNIFKNVPDIGSITLHFNTKNTINSVINDFRRHFNYPIKYTWYNYDITSNDYLPIIGEVSKDIFVATAFNKWGMTNSVLSASIISDLIKGNKNKYADVFSIKRKSLINTVCIKNMFDNVVTYFKPKKKNITYEYNNGIKYAVYTDNDGVCHKVIDKCPHLGCGLVFNEVDKTWDCPCHGSRYDIDGKVIHGPSYSSIKKK